MFSYSSIDQYLKALQEGGITCLQAVEHYLSAINNKRHLNAFVEVYTDEAIERAKELDAERKSGKPIGKLHGVVIGLKDVLAHKNHSLTAASNILKGFISIYTATSVQRLIDEGAIIIGSLNCDEFAMGSTNENSCYGKVLNAQDESRVPGGSSGGSAVAVQAGLCMVSLGSDTGGSVRQPADFCGLVGLKPSYGRISRYGLIAYASSFDQIGIFGKTVIDVALLLQVIAGPDEFDSTVSQKEVPDYLSTIESNKTYRFAYFKEALEHPSMDAEISESILEKIKLLQESGHVADPVKFDMLDYIVPAYYILTTAEASSNLSRYDGVKFGHRTAEKNIDLNQFYELSRSEGFGEEVKRRIMLGTFVLSAGYYDAYYTKAQQVRQLLCEKIKDIFSNYDFILLPTSPSTAFKIGEKTDDPIAMYLADIFTVLANLVGTAAISIPLFTHSNGMPFGLQLMSRQFEEAALLQSANQLMKKQ